MGKEIKVNWERWNFREALEAIVAKDPRVVGRAEAADMAVEFHMLASEVLHDNPPAVPDPRVQRLVEAVQKTMDYMIEKGIATPAVINTLEQALRAFDSASLKPAPDNWWIDPYGVAHCQDDPDENRVHVVPASRVQELEAKVAKLEQRNLLEAVFATDDRLREKLEKAEALIGEIAEANEHTTRIERIRELIAAWKGGKA